MKFWPKCSYCGEAHRPGAWNCEKVVECSGGVVCGGDATATAAKTDADRPVAVWDEDLKMTMPDLAVERPLSGFTDAEIAAEYRRRGLDGQAGSGFSEAVEAAGQAVVAGEPRGSDAADSKGGKGASGRDRTEYMRQYRAARKAARRLHKQGDGVRRSGAKP